jgi:protein O-mannosyl-transferase
MSAAKKRKTPARPLESRRPTALAEPVSLLAGAGAPGDRQRWPTIVIPLLVFVLMSGAVGLVYGPGLRAPFVHDDGASILGNHSIVRLWPLVGAPGPLNPVKDLPTSGRPLVNLSLALNYHFGHYDPLGYHLFNCAVHALSATLLWALIRRTLRLEYFRGAFDRTAGWLALGIALVWALHPLLTQSVEYVTQRSELMVGLCYLVTMYASLRYFTAATSGVRRVWLLAAMLACFAGMACKEVMVGAPVMVALFDRAFVAGSWRRALKESWPLYVGLAASWLLLIALNIGGPRSASAGFQAELPAHVWWLTQAKVVALYLKLAFWPSPLLMHYELPRLETLGAAWPWVLLVAALALGTLVLLYRKSAAGFLGAWFFLILAPTLLVPVVTEVAAERRMYLPLIVIVTSMILGMFKFVEWLGRRVAADEEAALRERRSAAIMLSATCALVAICGVASARRVEVYRDPVALWQTVLDAQPDNLVAHIGISDALLEAGRSTDAAEHIQKALSIAPDSYIPHHSAATLLLGRGQFAEAIAHFQKVVQLKPDSASAENNLAVALNAAGQTQEAIALYEKALQLEPDYLEARNNLATALANQGRLDAALEQYAIAVRMQPDFVGARKSMGIIFVRQGKLAEGIEQLEAAARLEPDLDTYARLVLAYKSSQRLSQALATAEQAIALARSLGQTEMVNRFEAMRAELLTRRAQ